MTAVLTVAPPRIFCSFCGGINGKIVGTEEGKTPRYFVCANCLAKFTQIIKHPS